jgi:hypothetical protein
MPIYKCTAFFTYAGQGWSETYYRTQTTPVGAQTDFQTLLNARAQILVYSAEISAQRISDVAIQRDSGLIARSVGGQWDKVESGDTPWQSMLCRLSSGTTYWRPLYVRGIPDAEWTSGDHSDPAWEKAVVKFFNAIIGGSFQMQVKTKNPALAPQLQVISVVPNPATGTVQISTVAAHNLAVGDRVQIYNFRGWRPAPGTKTVVIVNTATSFTVSGTPPAGWAYTSQGSIKKVVYDYVLIDDANVERVTHRIVGRPFGQQRGRRAARA